MEFGESIDFAFTITFKGQIQIAKEEAKSRN